MANIREKPSLNKLATESGINSNKLTLIFKELFGTTIYKFYKENRLIKVKKEILETNKSLAEIAYDFGFTDINHMSKSIIEKFGMSPTDIRKETD